jgi:hypothetical protein
MRCVPVSHGPRHHPPPRLPPLGGGRAWESLFWKSPKCCAAPLPRQFGEGEGAPLNWRPSADAVAGKPLVFASDMLLKTRTLLLKRSTKAVALRSSEAAGALLQCALCWLQRVKGYVHGRIYRYRERELCHAQKGLLDMHQGCFKHPFGLTLSFPLLLGKGARGTAAIALFVARGWRAASPVGRRVNDGHRLQSCL